MLGPAVTFLYSNCHLVLGSRGGRRKSKGPVHPSRLVLSCFNFKPLYNMFSDKTDLLIIERMR